MTYYATLGVSQDASQNDIKKAYRSLAMKHHPDRGGDADTFKNISVAYDTLSDENKRAQYDQQLMGGPQINMHNFGDINEMFGNMFRFGPGFAGFQQQGHIQKNRDLNLRCQITLRDSFVGKELEATYTLPSGKRQTVGITIPIGIENGQTIRYNGLGDDTYPQLQRGHLNVTVLVEPDINYHKRGDDICTVVNIDAFEAMLGCTKKVKTIDDKTLKIKIRPGIEHGGEYQAAGMGFQNAQRRTTGNFIIIVNITIPAITNDEIKTKLENIRDEFNAGS